MPPQLPDSVPWWDRVTASIRGTSAAVFLLLVLVYLPTADWDLPINSDALSNSVTAERLASTGSPVVSDEFQRLTEPDVYGYLGWFVETPRGVASKYPPGASLIGALPYLVAPGDAPQPQELVRFVEDGEPIQAVVPLPPLWPATLAAVLSSALASALLVPTLAGTVGIRRAAAWALVIGLGTSAWAVAAGSLWQHSVTILAMAAAVLLLSCGRPLSSGLSFGLAVLTRPLTALVPAVTGIVESVRQRRWGPVVGIGVGSSIGLVLLLGYNRWLFGSWSPLGGYQGEFGGPAGDAPWVGLNILEGLFGWRVGVLVWSPFVVVAIVALAAIPAVRRRLPGWAVAPALGGIVYLLAQWLLNRANPEQLPYRYPLEALFAAAAVLGVGFFAAWDRGGRARFVAGLAAGVAIAAQALAAIVSPSL